MTNIRLLLPMQLLICGLLVTNVFGQGVQPYPKAITDRIIRPETPMAAPPVNTVFADPDFGSLMVRVTDDNTWHRGIFFRNPATGITNTWSADSRKFYVVGQGGIDLAFAFNPSTLAISSLPGANPGKGLLLGLRPGPTFSFVDSDLIYGTTNAKRFTISQYRFSTHQITPVIDTTTCGLRPALDPSNPAVRSNDDVSLSADDNRISISEGGPQADRHIFVVVYDKKLGCRWYNTQTGEIGGQWGPAGIASVPDRYLIGHARISGNGKFIRIGVTHFGFYIWDLATLNVKPCPVHGPLDCAGYGAVGRATYINAPGRIDEMEVVKRPLTRLTAIKDLVSPLPTPHTFGQEQHFAWINGYLDDNAPICSTVYNYDGDTEISREWDDEIICIETDGAASTIWRFAHHRSYIVSGFFHTQPLGNISPDGRFFMFTSTWDGQVGTQPDGTPRSDVWIVKLK